MIEKLISLFHLPFPLGCLVLALLIGPTEAFLSAFLQTLDPSSALSDTVLLFVGDADSSLQSIASLALLVLSLFYVSFAIRYMRRRVVNAEAQLPSPARVFSLSFSS